MEHGGLGAICSTRRTGLGTGGSCFKRLATQAPAIQRIDLFGPKQQDKAYEAFLRVLSQEKCPVVQHTQLDRETWRSNNSSLLSTIEKPLVQQHPQNMIEIIAAIANRKH